MEKAAIQTKEIDKRLLGAIDKVSLSDRATQLTQLPQLDLKNNEFRRRRRANVLESCRACSQTRV